MNILKTGDIRINLKHVKILKNSVKDDFEKLDDSLDILEKYKFLKDDIMTRVNNNILFQPGRIVETVIAQAIADYLGCVYVGKGIYENDRFLIKQDGGSGKLDLYIIDKLYDIKYTYETKEPVAYGKSCGFVYDSQGKPIYFTSKDPIFNEYVKSLFDEGELLSGYNILENIGSNKIYEIENIIMNDFDFIISYDDKGFLLVMTIEEYKNNFRSQIEARSCGRNTRKVFTKDKLDLVDDILYLKPEELSEITQRGGKTSSRYKYIKNNATFSFNKKYVKEKDGQLFVPCNKIRQHVGEIAIQHIKKKI